jgi:hypothetical protein
MVIGERIDTTDEVDGITVRIKLVRNWPLILFLPVWLTFWTFGGIASIAATVTGQERDPIIYVWLCGWALGETYVVCLWLWAAFGEEIVSVRNDVFVYKRVVFGRGIARTHPVNEIFNLRASEFHGDRPGLFSIHHWEVGRGTVAVDTRFGDTYRFGIQLTERDAVALSNVLGSYLRRNI